MIDEDTKVGFCSKCGIIREDYKGIPVYDCVCTALIKHSKDCFYTKLIQCPVDLGMSCKTHQLEICENCDCDCKIKK